MIADIVYYERGIYSPAIRAKKGGSDDLESQSALANVGLILGIALTVVLIINGLLDMPAKLRSLWRLWRE